MTVFFCRVYERRCGVGKKQNKTGRRPDPILIKFRFAETKEKTDGTIVSVGVFARVSNNVRKKSRVSTKRLLSFDYKNWEKKFYFENNNNTYVNRCWRALLFVLFVTSPKQYNVKRRNTYRPRLVCASMYYIYIYMYYMRNTQHARVIITVIVAFYSQILFYTDADGARR